MTNKTVPFLLALMALLLLGGMLYPAQALGGALYPSLQGTLPPPTTPPPTWQAEAAEVGGGSLIQKTYTGYLGTGYVNFSTNGGYVEFRNLDWAGSGSKVLRLRYSLGDTSSRTGTLTVNGAGQSITFNPSGAWTTWATKDVTVTLASGTSNTIRLQSTGQDLPLLDQLEVWPVGLLPYQAEDAEVGGGAALITRYSGYRGTGAVDFPANGGYVAFRNVSGVGSGIRVLRFRYSLGSTSSRTGTLTVNGTSYSITFSPTGAWTTWATRDVFADLTSGTTNTIRLQSTGQDLPLLDQLEVKW